jgi:Flp pilus assembly protein TadG
MNTPCSGVSSAHSYKPTLNYRRGVRRERGSVIVTVAMALLFLLGFIGIAMDFGHLFVVKTELQTAADSCALAAVKELDGGSNAITRATNVGKAVGNLNKVNFQGASAGFVDADITFSSALTGVYSRTEPVATAKYAKCSSSKLNMRPWLLQTLSAVTGNVSFKANQSVLAVGVATRSPAQSACAIPVQINPKAGGAAPNYGYTPGEWIPSLFNENGAGNASNDLAPGHFGWANLDGSNSASEARDELLGYGVCNLSVGNTVGSPGAMVGLSTAWNSRFGLYKNGAGNPSVTTARPDVTGYAYTATNWPSRTNAIGDFLAKRADFRSYGNLTDTVAAGDTITGLNLPGSYQSANMATHGAGARFLGTVGGDRRLVLAPVVVGSAIASFACVLMLHPIDGPHVTVYLEFVGNASSPGSPCASVGLPGGTTGPLVPALVQ